MTDVDLREENFNRTGEVNVKDWGAKGDNMADDTASFEAAIHFLSASPAGGVLFVPPGTFKLSKKLEIAPTKPFVLRGVAPDVSRLFWQRCEESEGISIEPQGDINRWSIDGSVCVERLTLMCMAPEDRSRSSGLLISGEKQLSDSGQLCGRPFNRFRVNDLAMSGRWKYGLELYSTHLTSVKNLNIIGEGDISDPEGCLAGIFMHGTGSPTDHGIEGCTIFHVGTAIHLKSAAQGGRIEGVRVTGCTGVQCVRGVLAENVLFLSCTQNHFNVREVGIDSVDCDQSFYMGNLIYHFHGEGQGVSVAGTRPMGEPPATKHCVNGNIVIGVKESTALTGVQLAGRVNTAAVVNNICQAQCGVGYPQADDPNTPLRRLFCAGNVMNPREGDEEYHLPSHHVIVDDTSVQK